MLNRIHFKSFNFKSIKHLKWVTNKNMLWKRLPKSTFYIFQEIIHWLTQYMLIISKNSTFIYFGMNFPGKTYLDTGKNNNEFLHNICCLHLQYSYKHIKDQWIIHLQSMVLQEVLQNIQFWANYVDSLLFRVKSYGYTGGQIQIS
jgi:hypothetical protein